MIFPPVPLPSMRATAAALATLLWIGFAAAAGATTPDGASPETPKASAVELWKGRFCTATSCRATPASPLGAAASFGAAILAIRWMARRPSTRATAAGSGSSSSPAPSSD
jgi:hypothetical protein